MEKHIEKEYKVLVSKEKFYNLLNQYDIKFEKQINYYYDTPTYDIIKNKGAMRIREIEDTYLFTLKQPHEDALLEYECLVKAATVDALDTIEINEVLHNLQIHPPFIPLATLTTNRAMYRCDLYDLCFDISTYNGCIDYEIEYEYRKEHDGFTNFNSILFKINESYQSNCTPKIKRVLDSLNT